MTELIISEKPSSALKIAQALADDKLLQKKYKQSSFFELTHNKKKIIVTSAVGHLYGLVEAKHKSYDYPVFDIKWESSDKSSAELKYIKDYIENISQLAKKADEFTVACDYDIEGEVIGWNLIRFACGKKDANRMKFSTLTKPDLIEAYEQKMKHLDWGQANAGETRHILDWFYGINLSRALTSSVKAAGSFHVLSAGRVQGPTLKLIVDREKEIEKFKSEPFWQIQLEGEQHQQHLEAWHQKDKIFDKKEVERILHAVKDEKHAKVIDVKLSKREQQPPYPFDLTSLQTESYNLFKITPKETLAIAQSLYLAGVTSYPRTSSQQLDPKLGFKSILTQLSKQMDYEHLSKELLKLPALKPNNGKKTDPAHPAIYPTGQAPKTLKPRDHKIYDLVVKRFLATFAQPAIRETLEVNLEVKKEIFITKGSRTLEENWHRFYKPYVKLEEVTLPEMKKDDQVKIKKISKIDKETQPPNRYNQSSIIKEMEKINLGTKATRADILDRLFQRGYIEGVQIKASRLGIETIKVLEKYAPTIVDIKLTADFETEMDKIREGKQKSEKVVEKAKHFLTELLTDFKKKEVQVGKEIIVSLRQTMDEQNTVGKCPKCKGTLMIKHGKFGRFIACDNYPACKTTFNLPHNGLVKNSDKICAACNFPQVNIISKGNRPRLVCINPECPSKVDSAGRKEIQDLEKHKIKKKCPKCGKDLVLRRSIYGEFFGCGGYPNCKYTERLNHKNAEGKVIDGKIETKNYLKKQEAKEAAVKKGTVKKVGKK